MTYIINNLSSLERLETDKYLRNSIRKVQVDIDPIDGDHFARKINLHYFSCGCKEGSIAVSATLLIMAIIYFFTNWSIFAEWWYALIYLAIAAIFGKIFGVVFSKILIARTIRELKDLILQSERVI